MGGLPSWSITALRAESWRSIVGSSDYEARQIRYGILDHPAVPFMDGVVLGEIPQTEDDVEFGRVDLSKACGEGVYEEIGREEAMRVAGTGKMVSSAFVVWQGSGEGRKRRFVVNLSRQSKHWGKGTVNMETLPGFALELQREDMLTSFDDKGGYRHFYLRPEMRDYFVLGYDRRFYRFIAVQFGWGRSGYWFVKLMRPLVRRLREKEGYRVLPYLDDFLVAPSRPGTVSSARHCAEAREVIGRMQERLGIVRHP